MNFTLKKRYHTGLAASIIALMFALPARLLSQAPVNDDCFNAIAIPVPAAGFGLGTFISTQINPANATVQRGEAFAPAILVAGLNKKSIWYKFSIPTIRAVRVTLSQPGIAINGGDAGFTVYQSNSCLPGVAGISNKLTPIVTFGNTYHPCVPAGDYLIQVSAKTVANGPVNIELEIGDQTGAAFDHPAQAYDFGLANIYSRKIDFDTECQSVEDSAETCAGLFNGREYNKSAWFTFTTPAYFDYFIVTLSGTGTPQYFPGGGANILRKFGYNLYKGNVVSTPYNTLQVVSGCDSMLTDGYRAAVRQYRCSELEPNTTYSIQLFIHKTFSDRLRLGLITAGVSPTVASQPVTGMPPSNALGVLSASSTGIIHSVIDRFGCNSRHSVTACGPAIPAAGIDIGGKHYNLSSFGTFTLQEAAGIVFRPAMIPCGPRPLMRLFKQSLTSNCADLDPANLVGTATYNTLFECLAPGDYVVQVLGTDSAVAAGSYLFSTPDFNNDQCLFTNLGSLYRLDMVVYSRVVANQYSLNVTGAFDSINAIGNVLQPLADGVAYTSSKDTIGCQPTLRPSDTTCSPANDKVIYRQFKLADSGTINFSSLTNSTNSAFSYRLYSGDANALATAQNIFNFPDTITGLVPRSLCMNGVTCSANKSVCVIPGTYTFTSLASSADVGKIDQPVFTFSRTRTKHSSPFTAQDFGSIMDTLGVNGGTKKSDADYWSCDDNAVAINGYQPCVLGGVPATKAIYRQFYLKTAALVKIFNVPYFSCNEFAPAKKTLFYGKATDGLAGLSPVGHQWNCFDNAQTENGCTFLPAGWYTVVSYGTGPSYDDPTRLLNIDNRYNSYVGYKDEFNITITPSCPGPEFNRPFKASIDTSTHQPYLIEWADRAGSTPAYPRTDNAYVLPTEHFNCTLDTPFSNHPIQACEANSNRVAYFVFRTTQVCFLQINTDNFYASVYDKDVRTDSLQFANAVPIQECSRTAGFIQFCFFQPGTYTLVIFANDNSSCSSVTPKIYIDKIGYSRFDFAANAYDFGVVPGNNAYHSGKTGDVNPLDNARAPSNDFFYCTTGAFTTDPANAVCNTKVNPNVYNNGPNKPLYDAGFPGSNNVARRNLWYTFVAGAAGNVKVKVDSKTIGRGLQPKFAVYQSNVDGTLPFSTVQSSGEVDSTIAQGLSFIATNTSRYPFTCYSTSNVVLFYRNPCNAVPTRYYVLVENPNGAPAETGGQFPNSQLDVAVEIDSIGAASTAFDHYYLASDMGVLGVGTFNGTTDNYSCASRDNPDPVYNNYNNCTKTLWYKFTSTVTGNVRYRIWIGNTINVGYDQVQLFRQTVAGDSSINGLKIQLSSTVSTPGGAWAEACVAPGTYYLLLPGCSRLNDFVVPQIQLIEATGDFCSRPVPAAIAGPGSVTASALINCHTIGTDYGEFGPQLTCPQGATTAAYKSSWFRIDIGGTDTLDVTASLAENTNAASNEIKYRLMTGNCSAMQEQSCVQDALTQNTYQCLLPGQSYYVQVFTPTVKSGVVVTGTIDLKLTSVAHTDTCAPLTNCLVNANFDTAYNCSTSDLVKLVNFSTYGTSINYQWDFGYSGQISTAVSPSFLYPALPTDQDYTIKLVVTNTSCSKSDSVTRTITIPARPNVNLGNDIVQCSGGVPIILRATSHPGATYLWQNGSTADTLKVTSAGNTNYSVKVSYNGCSRSDTVRVLISPISANPLQQLYLCADSVLADVRRGYGETYSWSTGATTRSVYLSSPGYYWVDIGYFDCVYRDSFEVKTIDDAKPFGNDTTACLTGGGLLLRAATPGALSYSWQNSSNADTLLVTTPGEYRVAINFGNCVVKDTVNVLGYPAPLTAVIDTSICAGEALMLPWGTVVTNAGTYRDTIRYRGGCDSLVKLVNLAVKIKPSLAADTTICFAQGNYTINAAVPGAVSYQWQNGNTDSFFTVSGPGLYWVKVNYGTCFTSDSVTIYDYAAPVTVRTDTGICAGASFTLPWGPVVQTAGTYIDTLTASGGGCDSLIRIYNLAVHAKPALGNDAAAAICMGKSIDLRGYFNTTTLTSSWTVDGAAVTNTAAVFNAGTYQLIASNNFACADTALVTLTINPKPTLGNDSTIGICQGNSLDLTGIYNTGTNNNNWTNGGIVVVNPVSVNSAGLYQLESSTSAGCADTALVTLAVYPTPTLVIHDPATVCFPQTADLSAASVTAGSAAGLVFTYWQDSLASVAYNNSAAATTGTWYIKGTTGIGCSAIQPVTVSSYPVQIVNAGNDVGICDRDSIATLSVTVTNTSAALTYSWEPVVIGGIVSPAASSTIVRPAVSPQQYTVTVTDGFGCNYTVSDTVIVSKQPPVPAFAGNDTIAVVGLPHQLLATGGVNYTWSPGSVLNNPYVANPLATMYADSTLFSVIVLDITGCKGYDSVWVKAYDGITYYVPNAFSPNGDGINDVFRPVPVGILSTDIFRVFNRYGELVFETSQWMKGWDGTFKGRPQPAANYVWILRGKGRNGKAIEMKGNVVLVR